jgi:hypothetical protein
MARMDGGARRALWAVATVVVGIALIGRWRRARHADYLAGGELGDWSGPEEFEQLTEISKESYEQRLLVAARSDMMDDWTITPESGPPYTRQGVLDRGSVDEVRLEGEGLDAALVVLFRSDDRPGCVFGWRLPIWPVPSPDPEDPDSTPEGWAFILALNLRALRDARPGLPPCDPDANGITWVGTGDEDGDAPPWERTLDLVNSVLLLWRARKDPKRRQQATVAT